MQLNYFFSCIFIFSFILINTYITKKIKLNHNLFIGFKNLRNYIIISLVLLFIIDYSIFYLMNLLYINNFIENFTERVFINLIFIIFYFSRRTKVFFSIMLIITFFLFKINLLEIFIYSIIIIIYLETSKIFFSKKIFNKINNNYNLSVKILQFIELIERKMLGC